MQATPTTPQKKKRSIRSRDVLFHLIVGGLCLLMIYPIIWMISSSFKGPSEIWTNVTSLIPKTFAWGNYSEGWAGFGGITFATYFRNSLLYAGFGTLAIVGSSAFIAYGFARIKFKGRNFWFSIMILTLMLPGQVLLIPQYILFNELGWVNTFLPLIVPRLAGGPFFIFLMVQFIRGIPRDLDEAAEIDGAGRFAIFWRIILPLMQPALITAAIFSFYWTWEDFLSPLIYLSDPRLYTVSLALRSMADPNAATNWGAIFAMATLSLVPVFILFIAFQKYLVQGISTTGLKG
ncbi:MAG: carbohydrate ABC transporter permease [Anaerolineae bacterium]|nr:carbohydrate ABC transporter permease [Anaerolineae bacterium]MCO5206833.1 carbohydrate ABC transporter permease [Anaerolineae bacterium]